MGTAVIWAAVLLILGGGAIWRAERVARARIDASSEETTVAVAEREFALELRRRNTDDEAALQQAKLRQQAAEANRAALAAADTVTDATAAERQIIAARAAAEQSLAEELLRADRAAQRDRPATPSVVDEYAKYLEACARHHVPAVPFDTFANRLHG